jgi:hypothetical protein
MKTATPFKDSYGNVLSPGDKITIVSHYNYDFLNGQHALLKWDEKKGMYKYVYTEERRGKVFTSENNFYGVHEFKKGWE